MKKAAAPAKTYTVVGLQIQATMPIRFENTVYDLANLSDEDAAYLLQFPDQVPYLKAVPVTAPEE